MGGSRGKRRDAARADLTGWPVPVRQAAGLLGVSYSTLKQWIYQGKIRTTVTPGGHHRILPSEIDRMLALSDPVASASRAAARPEHPLIASISGRNQLRGFVEEVRVEGLLAQVRLRIGTEHLTAVITRDAVDELRLRRGDRATAIIKSTEVMLAREMEPDGRARRRS
jgi:molybdopterin-binding protein